MNVSKDYVAFPTNISEVWGHARGKWL